MTDLSNLSNSFNINCTLLSITMPQSMLITLKREYAYIIVQPGSSFSHLLQEISQMKASEKYCHYIADGQNETSP